MRQLSAAALQEMLAAQTGEVYLHLVKISHEDLASDLHFVDNTEDVVRTDATYTAAAFRVKLPDESDETPQLVLQIDNVDQSIIEVLRSLNTTPDLTVSVIRESAPNTVEVGPYEVQIEQFTYDKYMINAVLGYQKDQLRTRFPAYQFTPQTTPGIF